MIKYLITPKCLVKTNMPIIPDRWTNITEKKSDETAKQYKDRAEQEYKKLCEEKNNKIEKEDEKTTLHNP